MTISSHLPDLVAAYIAARDERLVADKKAADLKEYEEGLKTTIIAKFREEEINALGADNGLVKMSTLIEPVADNWPAVYKHVQETGDFSLLHRRLATAAVKEQWEAGVVIPGVGKTTIYKLSVSKPKV